MRTGDIIVMDVYRDQKEKDKGTYREDDLFRCSEKGSGGIKDT